MPWVTEASDRGLPLQPLGKDATCVLAEGGELTPFCPAPVVLRGRDLSDGSTGGKAASIACCGHEQSTRVVRMAFCPEGNLLVRPYGRAEILPPTPVLNNPKKAHRQPICQCSSQLPYPPLV